MSMVFETVGASAYLGGAQFIENKDYLTAAAVSTSSTVCGVRVSAQLTIRSVYPGRGVSSGFVGHVVRHEASAMERPVRHPTYAQRRILSGG